MAVRAYTLVEVIVDGIYLHLSSDDIPGWRLTPATWLIHEPTLDFCKTKFVGVTNPWA